jgi:hypothetical protein
MFYEIPGNFPGSFIINGIDIAVNDKLIQY